MQGALLYNKKMQNFSILNLDLRAPLVYRAATEAQPFSGETLCGEGIFHFAINPQQYLSIEPEEETYLDELIGRGILADGTDPEASSDSLQTGNTAAETLVLPAGPYLFAQTKGILRREDFVVMAVEVQKEGLWRDLVLDSTLYLRYLCEEGRPVTQIFRPIIRQQPDGSA
jgi:hypothetical protein